MIDRVACPLTGIHEAVLLSPILPMHQKDVDERTNERRGLEATSILVFVHVHQRPHILVRGATKSVNPATSSPVGVAFRLVKMHAATRH